MNLSTTGDFKQAMRRLVATVTLVTAGSGDGKNGMAATAVVSVCTDPPTLLVAVNRSASIHGLLGESEQFCVNLLSHRHQELVEAFSGKLKGAARFKIGNWRHTDGGVPVLLDALSSIVCRITKRIDIGTHTLFIGEAIEISNHAEILPLAWMDGGFTRCAPLEANV